MLEMTLSDGTWMKFYNKLSDTLAERKEGLTDTPGVRREWNRKTKQAYRVLEKIKAFFMPKLDQNDFLGLDKLGVACDHRVMELNEEDGDVVYEYFIVGDDGLRYSWDEARDPTLVMTQAELSVACEEVKKLGLRESEDVVS